MGYLVSETKLFHSDGIFRLRPNYFSFMRYLVSESKLFHFHGIFSEWEQIIYFHVIFSEWEQIISFSWDIYLFKNGGGGGQATPPPTLDLPLAVTLTLNWITSPGCKVRSLVLTYLAWSWLAIIKVGLPELQYFPITPSAVENHTPESRGSKDAWTRKNMNQHGRLVLSTKVCICDKLFPTNWLSACRDDNRKSCILNGKRLLCPAQDVYH